MAVIGISTRLTGFQRAAKSVKRLGDSFKRFGDKARAVGRIFVTRVLPAITAAGAAILALGGKFRSAFRDIAVATGAIGKRLDGLKADFRAILKTGPDSFKAVADSVGVLNTFLGLTGKPLQKLSRQILDLSRLLGDEAGPNTLLFAKALNQFNEPVKNASLILDQLFKVTQDTGIAFGELLNQILRQGPAFAPLNLSLIQVADLMGRFNKAGLRTRSLGPALLAFFAKAGKASKKTGEGLKEAAGAAGIAATNFRSLTSSTASLLERSRALAAGIGQTSEGLNKAAESMKGVGKALKTPTQAFEEIVRKIARTGDQLKQLSIASEAFGVDAAGVIVKAIRQRIIPALDELGKPLKDAAGLIKETTDETRTLGEVWGQVGNDIAVAFEPAALALDKFARESVPRLKRNTDRLAEFVAFLVQFGSRASTALGGIFDAIDPIKFGVTLNEAFPLWKAFIEGLIALFGQLATAIGEKFQQIRAIIGEALASLSKINFGAAVAKTLNFISESFKVWGSNVVNIVGNTVKGIRSWLVDKFNAIVRSITRAINRMVDAFRRARRAISSGSIVPDLVSGIGREFKKLDLSMVAVTARQTGRVIANFSRMNTAILATQRRALAAGLQIQARALLAAGALTGGFTGVAPAPIQSQRRFPPGFRPTFGGPGGLILGGPFRRQFAGVPGFQTGGSRVFTTPRLIEVAEHGAERITAEPLAGGRGGRGRTLIQNFNGLVLLDEIGAQKLGSEMARIIAREDRRRI